MAPLPNMQAAIINYLKLHPLDAVPFNDKREPLAARIWRILNRSKFRSAPTAPETIKAIQGHIHNQIKANQPIILVYAMGGGRGINTHNFPHADWGEYLHLKFLVESLSPIGKIYEPGVEVRWTLDDYAARIFNNYQPEWQEMYTRGFDAMLEYFNQASGGAIKHIRIPTSTWYPDYDVLRSKLFSLAQAKVGTDEATEIISQWGKRAANNYYNADNLQGDELQQAIEFSTLLNMAWLDYDFEVRGDYLGAGIPIAHFTALPDSLYIQTVPGSNVQFWKANGYLEHKDGHWKSRIATRESWKQLEPQMTMINNPLSGQLPDLGELPVLQAK